jgi:hypothetical protein
MTIATHLPARICLPLMLGILLGASVRRAEAIPMCEYDECDIATATCQVTDERWNCEEWQDGCESRRCEE